MNKTSFEEQFPGYDIIPEKKSKLAWPLVWVSSISLIVGLPLLLLYALGLFQVATPATAVLKQFATARLAGVATLQAKAENYTEAAHSFKLYFEMGGRDANMMALYAHSLFELGRQHEALDWSRRALATEPESKAARLINSALEAKK